MLVGAADTTQPYCLAKVRQDDEQAYNHRRNRHQGSAAEIQGLLASGSSQVRYHR